MPRLQRILVPTDFSPLSRVAIASALSLFKDAPATSLTLLHVVEPMHGPGILDPTLAVDFTLEARVEAASKELERLRAVYGPQVRLEARLLTGSPARTLCDLAAEERYDLIVLSSHGHTGLERILIGSVAEQVVQDARCPVLVVKLPRNDSGQFLPDPVNLKLDRLLVGYDHRRGAELALRTAMGLAKQFRSEIVLVHALEPAHFGLRRGPSCESKNESACVEQALGGLSAVRDRHLPESADWSLIAKVGHPWDVISDCAKQRQCDVVLVGPHDHTRWGHSFIGSTAQRVVRLAPCAVLTVK